ncbi:MAG: flagellar export protein FliJ [Thermodesulfobacteriota bacterium]|nr:flagellar export protein FliJ [Thermodesulfobacteriota bacterium]
MFKFQLEAVLNYRKLREEECEKQLGELNRLLHKEKQTLTSYVSSEKGYREELCKKQSYGITAFETQWYLSFFDMLTTKIKGQERIIKSTEKRIEEKRQELVKASQEKKIIEKLKEKKLNQFNKELNRKEQMLFDESGAYRHYFLPFLKK